MFLKRGLFKKTKNNILNSYYFFCNIVKDNVPYKKNTLNFFPKKLNNPNKALKYTLSRIKPTFFLFLKKNNKNKKKKDKPILEILNKKTKLLISFKLIKFFVNSFLKKKFSDKVSIFFLEIFLNFKNSLIFKKKTQLYKIAFKNLNN